MELIDIFLFCVFFGLTTFIWFCARKTLKRKRLIQDTPTSKTSGIFIGHVELKGQAVAEKPLIGYLTEKQCVYYSWRIEEEYVETDNNGKKSNKWKTIASQTEMIPFYLKDDWGVVQIIPKGAEFDLNSSFFATVHQSDPFYYDKGPQEALCHSKGVRRFTEKIIEINQKIYLIGQSRVRSDIVAPEIAQDDAQDDFFISDKDELKILRSKSQQLFFLFFTFLAIPFFYLFYLRSFANRWGEMVSRNFYLLIGALAGTLLLIWGTTVFLIILNSMIKLRNFVKQAWANIDVELKRRADLIPQLVRVVEGMTTHEKELQTHLAKLRSEAMASAHSSEQTASNLESVQKTLTVLVEKMPELKSNELFLRLQKELTITENRIALARNYYNDCVECYNNRLETFPDLFFAKILSFSAKEYISAKSFETVAVKINFE